MSEVWFCSDLHGGHKNIAKFRKEMDSEEHNREVITQAWNKLVTKRDLVWVLGGCSIHRRGCRLDRNPFGH